MAVFKGQIFINYEQFGWSETYWTSFGGSASPGDANNPASFGNAKKIFNELVDFRAKILTSVGRTQAIRISLLDTDNVTVVNTRLDESNFTVAGLAGDTPVGPWTSAGARMIAQNGAYVQPRMFRGIDSNMFTFNDGGSGFDYTSIGLQRMKSWLSYLAFSSAPPGGISGASYGSVVNNRDKTARKNALVTAAELDADTNQVIITVAQLQPYPLPTFNVAERVHIGKLKGLGTHGLNGETIILKVLPNNQYLTSKLMKCPGKDIIIRTPGQVWNHPKIYVAWGDWSLGRIAKRDTGKAFFATAGRASGGSC